MSVMSNLVFSVLINRIRFALDTYLLEERKEDLRVRIADVLFYFKQNCDAGREKQEEQSISISQKRVSPLFAVVLM